jgi:hypothetical protein
VRGSTEPGMYSSSRSCRPDDFIGTDVRLRYRPNLVRDDKGLLRERKPNLGGTANLYIRPEQRM